MSGILYICGTPIGNLDDMSFRAVHTLKTVDVVAAEDTRHTLKLLNHFDIKKKLLSYHEHNKMEKGKEIIELLLYGKNVALVSDAGLPGISDPGEDIVKLCVQNDIGIQIVPGPSAFVCAAVISGFSTKRIAFEGFLQGSGKKRTSFLNTLKNDVRTLVFYEAPHHLLSTLKEMLNCLGDRNCAIIREMTKKFEETKRGKLSEMVAFFEVNAPKGEFVIVLEGADEKEMRQKEIDTWNDVSVAEHFKLYKSKGFEDKEALKLTAKDRGLPKREIYKQIYRKEE